MDSAGLARNAGGVQGWGLAAPREEVAGAPRGEATRGLLSAPALPRSAANERYGRGGREGGGSGGREMEQKCKAAISHLVCLARKGGHGSTRRAGGRLERRAREGAARAGVGKGHVPGSEPRAAETVCGDARNWKIRDDTSSAELSAHPLLGRGEPSPALGFPPALLGAARPRAGGCRRAQQRLSRPQATDGQRRANGEPRVAEGSRALRLPRQLRRSVPKLALPLSPAAPLAPAAAPRARLSDKQSHLRGSGASLEHLKLLFLHLAAQCQPQFTLFVHLLREHYLISHPARGWGRGFSFSLPPEQVGHQGISANIL